MTITSNNDSNSTTNTTFQKDTGALNLLSIGDSNETYAIKILFSCREESLWKRKEAEYGHSIFKRGHDCPKDIYYCPETSPLVLAPGNPSKGEELFRKGYFDDVCR